MFGKNPKRKPVKSDGEILQIQQIFPTIQGEGQNVGYPAVFIRLGGCNLACSFCDTEFEDFQDWKLGKIIDETIALSKNKSGEVVRKLAVITGGEPFRQPIEKLCGQLIDNGYRVQIETNGTIYRNLPNEVEIVCSPKNTGNSYGKINEGLIEHVNSLKFIISANLQEYSDVPELDIRLKNKPIYIQPMDEYDAVKNAKNIKRCLKLLDNYGYLMSLQTHKILEID